MNNESPSRENQLTHRPARLPPLQNSPNQNPPGEVRIFRSASSNPQIAEFNAVLGDQVDEHVNNYVSNIIQEVVSPQPTFRQRQLNTNTRDPVTGIVPPNLEPVQTQESLIQTLQVVRFENSEIEYSSNYSEVPTESVEMQSSLFRDSQAVSNNQSSSQNRNSSESSPSRSSRVRGYLRRQMIGLLENNQSSSSVDIEIHEQTQAREQRPRIEAQLESTDRNLTISRLLDLYRNSRSQRDREQEISDSVSYRRFPRSPIRPLTQNFMEEVNQVNESLNEISQSIDRIQRLRRTGQINRAAGYQNDRILSPVPATQSQEMQIQNQFHQRSAGFVARQSSRAHIEQDSLERLANQADHRSSIDSTGQRTRLLSEQFTGVGQTSTFLQRRHELWMNRNLRHQRRIAGVSDYSEISVPQQMYNPGIRIRDLRRGPDFYPQDQALRGDEEPNDSSTEHETRFLDTSPARTRLQLCEMYISLFDNIPERWRNEELCRENICQKENLVSYLENYGSLAVLIFVRTQEEVAKSEMEQKQNKGSKKTQGDMTALSYISMSNDYIKFVLRLLSFYSYNFKQTINYNNQYVSSLSSSLEAQERLQKLIDLVIPSCKELKSVLRQKRKKRGYKVDHRSRYYDSEFPYDDENIIYIVTLKILESYHFQFSKNTYLSDFVPLALEFYKNHANSSDLILVNSLIRYLNVYFPNLEQSKFLVTKEEHVKYFEREHLKGNIIEEKASKKRKKNVQSYQGPKLLDLEK